MQPTTRTEKKKIAALFVAPFLVLGSMFGARAVVSHFKTQDLIKWIGFQNDEWAQQALAEGANPNAHTPDGWSMVMWAVGNNGNTTIVKMLKDAGAKTDATENLFIAVLEDNESAVLAALQQRANLNAIEKDGWTPLMWAACRTHPKIIKLLLNAGANVNWKSKDGKTPISVACEDLFGAQPWGCGPNAPKGLPCKMPARCTQTVQLLKSAVKASKRCYSN